MTKKLSASQAAKQVGKAIPTITRAIKKGKLSATKTDEGGYLIDPAELFRVWPAAGDVEPVAQDNVLGGETRQTASAQEGHEAGLSSNNAALEAEAHFLRKMLEEREATIAELKAEKAEAVADAQRERDEWRDQLKAQTRLLADQRPRGLLEWITGLTPKT